MDTMITYSAVLCSIAIVLCICMIRSIKSKRSISWEVTWLLGFVLFAVITSLVSVFCPTKSLALIFSSLYEGSLFLVYYAMLRFVMKYCGYTWGKGKIKELLFIISSAVAVAVFTNPVNHWAFDLNETLIDGRVIYTVSNYNWFNYIAMTVLYTLALATVIALVRKITQSSILVVDQYFFILVTFVLTILISAFIDVNAGYNLSIICSSIYCIFIYYYSIEHVQVRLIDRMKSTIVSTVKDSVLFFDENRKCVYANNAARMVFDIKDDKDMDEISGVIIKTLGETESSIMQLKNKHCNVKYTSGAIDYIFLAEYHKLFDGKGKQIGSFVNFNDVTELTQKAERDHYIAAHDSLTGLYNGRYFTELVDEKLGEVNPEDYVAIVTDIRGFKLINDKYGHDKGDEILKKIADVVNKNCCMSSRTIYARLMTDRFAVFMPKSLLDEDVLLKVLDDFEESFGHEYSVVVHIGVYELTAEENDASSIFDKALIAIGSVKNNLEQRIAYYSNEMRDALIWEQKINATLDEAIRRGKIVPYLQAQVDEEGNVVGAEVLVRWIDDEGVIPPFKFIPVLEKNGTISKVDLCMWENACKILKEWENQGKDDMYLSVNVSPKDFYILDVVKEMKALTDKYNVDPKRLRLEITESMMMDDADMKMQILDDLRQAGFIIEMDDFGSGYSSLNLLKDMPVDIIKLDMMFMSKTTNQERTDIIVNLIIKLAYDLGLTVIAEGVETKDQFDSLMGMGCKSFQGYYFAKPIPLGDFEKAI